MEAVIEKLRLEVHKTKSFSPEQVRAEIARLELTVEEYARLMEVTPATVYLWMRRKTRPRRRNLDRWFALQGITREEARSALGIEPRPTQRRTTASSTKRQPDANPEGGLRGGDRKGGLRGGDRS